MDVTCTSCGTEYEFDETLVAKDGTRVKCTRCGAVFTIFADPSRLPAAAGWQVQHPTQGWQNYDSLRALRRAIVGGQLGPDDPIRRGDGPAKRLGDIAELAALFSQATTRAAPLPSRPPAAAAPPGGPAAPASLRPGQATVLGVGLAATPSASAPPPARLPASSPAHQPSAATTEHSVAGPMPTIAVGQPPSSPAPSVSRAVTPAPVATTPAPVRPAAPVPAAPPATPASVRPATPAPATPSAMPTSAPPVTSPPAAPAPVAASGAPVSAPAGAAVSGPKERALFIDEAAEARPDGRLPRATTARAWPWWVLLGAMALAAAVVAVWFSPQLQAWLPGGAAQDTRADPAPIAPYLERASAQLTQHSASAFAAALEELEQARALAPKDPVPRFQMAHTHVLWAQMLRFQADDWRKQHQRDGAEARRLMRDARRHAEQAFREAKSLATLAPGTPQTELVMAAALRLTGDFPGARRALQALSRATLPRAVRALHAREHALLSYAASPPRLREAEQEARVALATEPGQLRHHLLLFRLLALQERADDARGVLDDIPPDLRQHAAVRALDLWLPAEGAAPSVDSPPVTPADSPRAGGYAAQVAAAEVHLEHGRVKQAKAHLKAALAERPQGPEALTGMGYVMLNAHQPGRAARRFEAAAQQGYAEALIGLGAAERRRGDGAAALRAYQQYLKKKPQGKHVALAERQVELLGVALRRQSSSRSAARERDVAPRAATPTEAMPRPSAPAPAGPVGDAPAPPAAAAPEPPASYEPAGEMPEEDAAPPRAEDVL
ncbi:MAG: zinc-ribbon domain-containing protein [Polyangiales bacterium]